MVTYRMDLSDEKKDAAVEIALESPRNVRRRRICGPLLVLAGALLLVCGSALVLAKGSAQGVVFLVVGVASLALGLRAKAFQRFVLRRSERLLDKAFRSGIVEYAFDEDGVRIESNLGSSLCYWNSFVEHGTMGQYLYLKRGDNKLVLVDANDLTEAELAELTDLFSRHVPGR